MDFLKNWLNNTSFDFVGWRYIMGGISAAMVVLAWVVFVAIGPNWGIDFTGGTEVQLKFESDEGVTIEDMRGALRELGLSDDAVQEVGGAGSSEFTIRIQDAEFGARELRETVEGALKESYGDNWIASTDFNAEVGARLTVNYTGDRVPYTEVAKVLEKQKDTLGGFKVEAGKEDNQVVIKLPGLAQQVQKNIKTAMGDHEFEVLSVEAVGPKVGGELRRQGFISILATLGLVLLYVAFRFDLGFAPGAVIALFHDVSVTVGIFVLAQLEFNLPMIGALLTIVGYSLNDTIVIYDRIRENKDRYRRKDLSELINVSINETLARTIATSFTTMIAIMAFLILGGPVIRNFAFAMFLGIVFGTYSTIFVATPMILVMEDLKPFLSKFVALPATVDNPPAEGQGVDDHALSETEKRRRARQGMDDGDSPAV